MEMENTLISSGKLTLILSFMANFLQRKAPQKEMLIPHHFLGQNWQNGSNVLGNVCAAHAHMASAQIEQKRYYARFDQSQNLAKNIF